MYIYIYTYIYMLWATQPNLVYSFIFHTFVNTVVWAGIDFGIVQMTPQHMGCYYGPGLKLDLTRRSASGPTIFHFYFHVSVKPVPVSGTHFLGTTESRQYFRRREQIRRTREQACRKGD